MGSSYRVAVHKVERTEVDGFISFIILHMEREADEALPGRIFSLDVKLNRSMAELRTVQQEKTIAGKRIQAHAGFFVFLDDFHLSIYDSPLPRVLQIWANGLGLHAGNTETQQQRQECEFHIAGFYLNALFYRSEFVH